MMLPAKKMQVKGCEAAVFMVARASPPHWAAVVDHMVLIRPVWPAQLLHQTWGTNHSLGGGQRSCLAPLCELFKGGSFIYTFFIMNQFDCNTYLLARKWLSQNFSHGAAVEKWVYINSYLYFGQQLICIYYIFKFWFDVKNIKIKKWVTCLYIIWLKILRTETIFLFCCHCGVIKFILIILCLIHRV